MTCLGRSSQPGGSPSPPEIVAGESGMLGSSPKPALHSGLAERCNSAVFAEMGQVVISGCISERWIGYAAGLMGARRGTLHSHQNADNPSQATDHRRRAPPEKRGNMEQSKFIKLQQDITDQELREMPAEEVDEILSDMKAEEAFDFLERIGHLRAWLVYAALGRRTS